MQMIMMKKKYREFMSNGRSEFNIQLLKWQQFFEENSEDVSDMQCKMEELVNLCSILSSQVEDLQVQVQSN